MDYGLIAKPLYEAQKMQPFTWGKPQEEAFLKLKEALTTAPALGLPDLSKDFQLFAHERLCLALGVLTQFTTTVILIQEARKITMGRHIDVYVPHMVTTVLEQKGDHWLSPSRMMKFQVILMDQDDVTLKTTNLLNPALFLGTPSEENSLEHDCMEVIEHTCAARADLKGVLLEQPDWELFTDGSSFVENRICWICSNNNKYSGRGKSIATKYICP
ncbi:hypothetical protein DV515_00017547 [Chloebia gouldiae]|uniref:Reverse transcriptase/retrotransposon-derived protein RNase H-like domain-containing protein n=1 Tax=Chloebia gouldiae TaxID=44316 RepID=A0A3L8QA12_CHLGU|nr:hypothetical protein DV515_00017547 [Chloebia gouldiae]